MEYVKHFNDKTENYLSYRPTYPEGLFDFLMTLAPKHSIVWDCGTGNGQAAFSLAQRDFYVLATDINPSPLAVGLKSKGVEYLCCTAEQTCFADKTINLITIAQALHWFDLEKFYTEVQRVAASNSTIAAWCYPLCKINPRIDAIVSTLYVDILGAGYWPKERSYIDEEYRTILFPFTKMATPELMIEKKLNLESFIGYLNTWSAIKEYEKKNHSNPINLIAKDLETAWGDVRHEHTIHWPIHLLAGRVK